MWTAAQPPPSATIPPGRGSSHDPFMSNAVDHIGILVRDLDVGGASGALGAGGSV
jgi:hypothetical protein